MSGCTGHCCRDFVLLFSPVQLVTIRDNFLKYQAGELTDEDDFFNVGPDILTIYDMVRYLGYYEEPPQMQSGRSFVNRAYEHHYTCKNLQKDGRCGIYERRPKMCREFPSGRQCCYAQCTWKAVNGEDGTIYDPCEDRVS